ncbi:translation protein SH3-like domain-containing protein [Annulohypoxylon maeteangense]|uniref:translation protein SH3-like domain-containing protein n=1 Tax=Annulohypoxylon maeteangense TaxID=1927788 RepID=UPI0020088DD5|nr:translation protein SH3-like domain-containing protein [Annulohypoxylon maeteangense]KAI0887351.1 translation protein SH3-like domain-containing protein [Annulohypoxylon maeteangense]
MITQSTRRPLSSWKAVLRRTRQQQQHRTPAVFRSMATEITPTTPEAAAPPAPAPASATPSPATIPVRKITFHAIRSPTTPNKPIRTAFAIYPRVPSARKTNPAALEAFHAQQIRRLDRTGARASLFNKKNPDCAKPGDVLQVTTRKGGGEPFAGVCLSIRRAGVDTAILLRNHISRVPVEMWYKIFSPNVQGIEIVWRRPKRARRARLTYMRKPKYDMKNVDHLVENWRRTRNVFSKAGGKGKGKGVKR